MPDFEVQVLINFIKGFRVDSFGDIGVLLGPVLEDEFKIRADPHGFFQEFFDVLVEEKLQRVSNQHQVKNQILVLGLVVQVAHHITHLIRVLGYQLVFYVPVCLSYHIREEDGLHLIHQENLSNGLEDFVNRVLEGDRATSGHGTENGHHVPELAATVGVEGLAVLGGYVDISLLSAHHK